MDVVTKKVLGRVVRGSAPYIDGYAPLTYFNFERATSRDPLTFARAGGRTIVGADSNITSIASGVVPFEYSSGARRLNMESQVTNYVTRSSHTASYPWNDGFTSNGIRGDIVGAGFVGDVPYADYALTGTATVGGAEPFVISVLNSVTTAAQDETYTASCYFQLISGAWPAGVGLVAGVFELNSGSYITGSAGAGIEPTSDVLRYSHPRTLSNASTNQVRSAIRLQAMTVGVTTFTGQVVRIYGWQLEMSPAATSLVQTLDGTDVTRAADLAQIDLTSYDLSAGYWQVITLNLRGSMGASDMVIQSDNGDGGNRCDIYHEESSGKIVATQRAAGVSTGLSSKDYTFGEEKTIAVRYGPDKFAVVWWDGTIVEDTDCDYVAPTVAYLAASNASGSNKPASLDLAHVDFYPAAITPTEMKGALGL